MPHPMKCSGDLVGDPLGSWIWRHIGPDELSPLQTQDDQPVEQFEPDRRNDEQIDGRRCGRCDCAGKPANPESEGPNAVTCTWRQSNVAVNRDGDSYAITPLFVSITPSITLTDHDGQPDSEAPP